MKTMLKNHFISGSGGFADASLSLWHQIESFSFFYAIEDFGGDGVGATDEEGAGDGQRRLHTHRRRHHGWKRSHTNHWSSSSLDQLSISLYFCRFRFITVYFYFYTNLSQVWGRRPWNTNYVKFRLVSRTYKRHLCHHLSLLASPISVAFSNLSICFSRGFHYRLFQL